MGKTYKHKQTGWITEKRTDDEYQVKCGDKGYQILSKELIENSDDWILQIDEDWRDGLRDKFVDRDYKDRFDMTNTKKEFKRVIESNMSKITEEELNGVWMKDLNSEKSFRNIKAYLKEKGLYEE